MNAHAFPLPVEASPAKGEVQAPTTFKSIAFDVCFDIDSLDTYKAAEQDARVSSGRKAWR
jgi:hypothetical protein